MQDRYSGDVGDFMKLGLLRHLAGDDLRLGINWYRGPDESHNADGKHTSYLAPDNAIGRRLRTCDPSLYDALAAMVAKGDRSVAQLESLGVLPASTSTYSTSLGGGMTTGQRHRWHEDGLAKLSGSDLVFLDPDNGLRAGAGPKAEKYALAEEVSDYFARGSSVVLYHHADRSKGGVPVQVTRRLDDLGNAVGVAPLGAVIARRGSCRFFLIAAHDAHRDRLNDRLGHYKVTWKGHAELIECGG